VGDGLARVGFRCERVHSGAGRKSRGVTLASTEAAVCTLPSKFHCAIVVAKEEAVAIGEKKRTFSELKLLRWRVSGRYNMEKSGTNDAKGSEEFGEDI